MPITELPPFTPRLEDYHAEEFLAHTQAVLAFPIELDQRELDLLPFRVKKPAPPREPPIPLLPHIWYPKPARSVLERLPRLTAPPPVRFPFLGKSANEAAERVLRPLLAGDGAITVRGETGTGKTALLLHVANHERTKLRFRRIWWFDAPERVGQMLAVAFGSSRALAEPDPVRQLEIIKDEIDETILLVVDNLSEDHPLLPVLQNFSPFVLLAARTPPEILEEDMELPPDLPGTVTLRSLAPEEGADFLAQITNLKDAKGVPREITPVIEEIAEILNYSPAMLALAGSIITEDGLTIGQLYDLLSSGEGDVLALSLGALPAEYLKLLEAFAVFSPLGTSLEALEHVLKTRNELNIRRGLHFLMRRRLVVKDERYENRYFLSRLLYDRLVDPRGHEPGQILGKQARASIIALAESASHDPDILFENEDHFRYAYAAASRFQLSDVFLKLNRALSNYLHTYLPAYLPSDAPPPRMTGDRAQAVQLARQGLDTAEKGSVEDGVLLMETAIQQIQAHGSDHDHAEGLVMLARIQDRYGRHEHAIELLEKAAKLVYDLNAEESVSVIRQGLAVVYRHHGRLREALAVLDEAPETYAERVRIFRAMENVDAMLEALTMAQDLTPYARAEAFLYASRYADALEAIADNDDPTTHYLRAVIYHLQGALSQALTGYEQALGAYREDDSERAVLHRAAAAIRIMQGERAQAEAEINRGLKLLETVDDPLQTGLTLGLLAAIHLCNDENERAVETAKQALEAMPSDVQPGEIAEIYRTLGRAQWRLQNYQEALNAFNQEIEHAQSHSPRDEVQIGMALFHAAEAYRITGQADRAVGNHRRALLQLPQENHPVVFDVIQTALYHALYEVGRYQDAESVSGEVLERLDSNPPADLQKLGYILAYRVRIFQGLGRSQEAYQVFSRWLNTLAGRADALTNNEQPVLRVLTLSLAARSLMAHQRYEEGVEIAHQAMIDAEDVMADTPPAWAARRDYGEILLALQRWQDAYDALIPLLQEKLQGEPRIYATAQESAGYALHRLGDDQAAIELYQAAFAHEPIRHKQGLLLEHVAQSALLLGNIDIVIEKLQEATQYLDRDAMPGDVARVLTSLAHTLTGVNRYPEAIGVYENALAMLRTMPDASPLYTAQVYLSLGQSNEAQGQRDEAAAAYRDALRIIKENQVNAPDDHRRAFLLLARITLDMNDPAGAIPYFEQARDLAQAHGQPQEVGSIMHELASAQRDSYALQDSLKTFEEALDLLSDQYPQDRAAVLRSYGRTLAQTQQFDQARKAWSEALAIGGENDPAEMALTHRAIGQAFRAQSEFDSAEKSFRKALEYHVDGSKESAATYAELGEMLLEAGRPAEAITPLQNALDIEKTLPQQSNARLVNILEMLATAEKQRSNRAGAIARYHAALVYMDRGFQPVRYADTLRTLGRLYMDGRAWDHCQKALGEAIDIELSAETRSEERLALTFRLSADAYLEEGHLEKAANAYKKMATYSNLSNEDTKKLRSTLDDIERHKAAITTAFESLQVLEKTNAEVKDIIFVYALIIKSHFQLSELDKSGAMMEKLEQLLDANVDVFSTEDDRSEYRSLANLQLALAYEGQGDRHQAQEHYRAALKDNSNNAMGWIIERGLEANL